MEEYEHVVDEPEHVTEEDNFIGVRDCGYQFLLEPRVEELVLDV